MGVSVAFEPARLTQARRLAGLTKRALAAAVGVSPAAVGQWESGATAPRPDHIKRLAELLEVPAAFFAAGRRYDRLEVADAHFRRLRTTSATERARAVAFAEQVWELAYALEKRVQFPAVDLPGFSGGEVHPGHYADDPAAAAAELRRRWGLGDGPIAHLVRTMERHGLIVTLARFAGNATPTIDAFSTSRLPRPVVVLTPDRADDVYRHRFTAAHELGHLMLHGDAVPGDAVQEREADVFAAELLTPQAIIVSQLPPKMDFPELERLGRTWGVGVDSLVYRCHEVGMISNATYRRAFQRLRQLQDLGLFGRESVERYPGEQPALLRRAFEVATDHHELTVPTLADELTISRQRLRFLLGQPNERPVLHLV